MSQEREAATKMFKGKKGQALASDIGKRSKTFVPGEKIPEKKTGPSKEDIELIKVSYHEGKGGEEGHETTYWNYINTFNRSIVFPKEYYGGNLTPMNE